jgi:hypothetical protein
MDDPAPLYTHHAACGCTFDQEDAPAVPCPAGATLLERRQAAIAAGDADAIRGADAAYHEHLAAALADAKRE